MARPESRYTCQACGRVYPRWEGRCHACGAWDTLVETLVSSREVARERSRRVVGGTASPTPTALSRVELADEPRRPVGIDEVDRVLGGGIVPGSLLLLGGEPGIGKSTLVLETAAGLTRDPVGGNVLYASGEESPAQLRLRASRLGLDRGTAGDRISLLATTEVEQVLAAAEADPPALVVVDSIQTMTTDGLEGPQGSVGQVRESAARLGAFAKEHGIPIVLIGHVTKEGTIAGPKTLEHLVDAVLTLEGERHGSLRLLRATKNRYASTEEVGVLEMTAEGLRPVSDPGRAFLGERSSEAPGVSIAATLEGTRPMLIEVQALVAPTRYAGPRRTAAGVDGDRLALLVAVLARRCGVDLTGHDLYVSLAGGAVVGEPALDLAVAIALASSLRDRPVREGTVVCGEVSLLGELRPAHGLSRRLLEASRLGFTHAVVPWSSAPSERVPGVEVVPARTLREAMGLLLMPPTATVSEGRTRPGPAVGSASG